VGLGEGVGVGVGLGSGLGLGLELEFELEFELELCELPFDELVCRAPHPASAIVAASETKNRDLDLYMGICIAASRRGSALRDLNMALWSALALEG
jgi:hypothetical protein